MGRQGESADSGIFVRFKHHVDSHVASGLNTLLAMAPDSVPRGPPSSYPMGLEDTRRAPWSLEIFSLLYSSSYSPLALRHLPQPVPNDVAPAMDSTAFTFEDAFEDLLAVSQGQPLPEIHTRYQQRRLLRQMFSGGEPAWFWMRRLESQRLIQAPSWGAYSPMLRPDWDDFHRATDWSELWRAAISDDSPEMRHEDSVHHQAKSSCAERTFREADSRHEWPGSQEKQSRRPAPDTFDELFSSLTSTFTEGQKTWDAFLNVITAHIAPDEKRSDPESTSGSKQVESRDEYVDRAGYLHSTVTRRTLDERGSEIGRETFVTMRPADGQDHGRDDVDGKLSADKRAGWFWK